MKLVFNRSQNTVVYGDGLMVTPGEFAYVDDEKYRGVDEAIADGSLIEKDIPAEMPKNVSESAAHALKAAIEDQPKAEAVEVADAEEDKADRPVRNTGRSRNTKEQKGA
ncbi:hypothetical protein SEA_DALANDE_38 [Gordonia phage DalanDe]|nr:hypothetical protein SEA_DALANDE_38 [Gordonia phage DalanDe]